MGWGWGQHAGGFASPQHGQDPPSIRLRLGMGPVGSIHPPSRTDNRRARTDPVSAWGTVAAPGPEPRSRPGSRRR